MKPEWVIYGVFVAILAALAVSNIRYLVLPDRFTVPGIFVGLIASWFFPALQDQSNHWQSFARSSLGLVTGFGVLWIIRFVGKKSFGRQRLPIPAGSNVVFTTTGIQLPDIEFQYEDIFYRNSDQVELRATGIELVKANGEIVKGPESTDVPLSLSPKKLFIGAQSYEPEEIQRIELRADEIILPREVIGFGLVKLAALIGAFLGWKGCVFALACGGSAVAASTVALSVGFSFRTIRFEAATPICIASLAWILIGKQLVLAATIATAAGILVSCVHSAITTRKSQPIETS